MNDQAENAAALEPFEVRAERVLAITFRGIHHCDKITKHEWGWTTLADVMATFDFDELTRLVIAAHDECVRVQVSPAGCRRIKLTLHDRKRVGHIFTRHPTLEQAIEALRGHLASEVGNG